MWLDRFPGHLELACMAFSLGLRGTHLESRDRGNVSPRPGRICREVSGPSAQSQIASDRGGRTICLGESLSRTICPDVGSPLLDMSPPILPIIGLHERLIIAHTQTSTTSPQTRPIPAQIVDVPSTSQATALPRVRFKQSHTG